MPELKNSIIKSNIYPRHDKLTNDIAVQPMILVRALKISCGRKIVIYKQLLFWKFYLDHVVI